MKKDKKGNKKAITIRIDEQTIKDFENTLTAIYGSDQRKKSATIELLIKQFNNQNIKELKEYLNNNKDIINLNSATINDKDAEIQDLTKKIENKEQAILSLSNKINEQEKQLKDSQEKIETLNQTIKEKNKTIGDKDKTIADRDATINDKDAEKIKAENKLKTLDARYEKLLEESNKLDKQNRLYYDTFVEVKNLSFIDRLLGKYPKKVLELPENTSSN